MKNNKIILPVSIHNILGTLALAGTLLIGCAKDHCHPEDQIINTPSDAAPQTDLTAEVTAMQKEYSAAKSANDTLALFHDSLQMCHSNMNMNMNMAHDSTHYIAMMSHCDSMYHSHDSLMLAHHTTCHSAMHSGSGGMMDSGMDGGMMNNSNNMNMDCTINGMQCQMAIDSLHAMHTNHHQ